VVISVVARRVLLALAVCLAGWPVSGETQEYPNKPIRFVVPWPPGGGADIASRIVGQRVSELLGQPLVVDNRAGAGGNIGAEIGARAAPDGYTILFGYIGTHAINPGLYRKMPFEAKDLAPITQLTSVTNVLVVHPSVAAHSVGELIALARANPGKLNYSSSGNGSLPHLAAELFKTKAQIDLVHVPFKGGGPAVAALVSGEVHLAFADPLAAMSGIKSDQLRALALTSGTRSAALPDIPTVAETGLPGFEATGWNGILVPAGVPEPIVAKLHDAFVAALKTPAVAARLSEQGYEPVGNSPAEFGAFITAETAKWAPVIKASGAQID
jgi:tripartite-type tricarboxylate transporter receptor subunit TctC